MATLPPSIDFTGSSVTQGGFKTAITTLRTFIADLLGTDSADKAAARAALGARGVADDVALAAGKVLIFEGSSDDAYETTLTVTNPTADRTATLPDADINVAGINVDQQFSKIQRTTPATDNDLSFDIGSSATTQDFICTPTGGGTLTFTNIRAGVKGEILLVNDSNYAIAKAATVKAPSNFLTTVSATGRYRLAYSSLDGTNVDITASAALS